MMSRAIWQTIDHREADHGEHQGIIRRNTSSSARDITDTLCADGKTERVTNYYRVARLNL